MKSPRSARSRGRVTMSTRVLSHKLALLLASMTVAAQFAPSTAIAQTAESGSLRGRVLNAANGMYLGNARVTVEGTNIETFTNQFGEYTVSNVPAGTVTIRVTYTGQMPQVSTVVVSAGTTAIQDITFNTSESASGDDGTLVLNEFTVAASRFRNAQQIATSEERFSPTIKNVVSSDAFGDIPSGNVGEMVKFIPGIQIDYGNYGGANFGNAQRDATRVSVRGFDEQDTAILIDGMPVSSSAPGSLSRTISLDMLSVNNASRVEVVKVATPDMPNNSLGGQINLITKSAFEYNKINTSFRVFTQLSSEDTITLKRTGSPAGGYSYKTQPSFDATVILPLSSKYGLTFTGARLYEYGVQTRAQTYWHYSGRDQRNATQGGPPNGNNVPGLITNSAGVGLSYSNPYLSRLQLTDSPQETERYSGNVKFDWRPNQYHTIALNVQYSQYTGSDSARRLDYRIGSANPGLAGINTTNLNGGGVINTAGLLTLNQTPLDWSPTYTISRTAGGGLSTGNNAGLEILNAFDKEGETLTTALSWGFRKGGWLADLKINRSESDAAFDTIKNGHFSGAAASLATGIGSMRFLNIDDGVPREVQIYNTSGQKMETQNLSAWGPSSLVARWGDSQTNSVKSNYQLDVRRTLDFIPVSFMKNTSLKIGVRRDEEKLNKTGSGTNLQADLSPTSPLTAAQIFSQILDTRMVTSPGYGHAAQQWMDPYKLYALDKQHGLFQQTPQNRVNTYNNYADQQRSWTERKDGWYAMLDGKFFNNRLAVLAGLRQETTSRKGLTAKRFNNAPYVTYADGSRFKDSNSLSGYRIDQSSSLVFAQTAQGDALRATLNSLGLYYPTTPIVVATDVEYAKRARPALQAVDAKVSGDPTYTVAANYEVTDKIGIKTSYSRSQGLPKIEDAANGLLSGSGGYTVVDYDASVVGPDKDGVAEADGYTVNGYYGQITLANPALKPSVSDNIDIQLSYYTDNGGKFAVSYFTKSVSNQNVRLDIPQGSSLYQTLMAEVGLDKPYYISTTVNVPDKQKTHGYEFEARQNLEIINLWGWGKAFTVFGSWTINSLGKPITLPPQRFQTTSGTYDTVTPTASIAPRKATHFGSVGLFFERGRISATARGVYRGRNETAHTILLDTATPVHNQWNVIRQYEPEEFRVDLSVTARLTKRFSLFGAVRDITYHKKEIELEDDLGLIPDYARVSDRRSYGAMISVGIRGDL